MPITKKGRLLLPRVSKETTTSLQKLYDETKAKWPNADRIMIEIDTNAGVTRVYARIANITCQVSPMVSHKKRKKK